MRTLLKWIGLGLGGPVVLIGLAVGAVYALSEARFNRTYAVPVQPVAIPVDADSIAYGEHIASIRFEERLSR